MVISFLSNFPNLFFLKRKPQPSSSQNPFCAGNEYPVSLFESKPQAGIVARPPKRLWSTFHPLHAQALRSLIWKEPKTCSRALELASPRDWFNRGWQLWN